MKKLNLLKLSDEERAASERRELFDMLDGSSDRGPLVVRWTTEAIAFAERIGAEGTPLRETCALFCIRVFDLLHAVSKWARAAAQSSEDEPGDEAFVPLCFELEDLRALLTDDELLWLEWRRDREAHVWVDHAVTEPFASRMLRTEVTFAARREACERVTKSAGDDDAVAVVIARKTIDGLRRVLDAVNALAV